MRVEVVAGPMFAGKSLEEIRRLERAAHANQKILLIKPGIDNRGKRDIFSMVKENVKLSSYDNLTMKVLNSPKDLGDLFKPPNFDVLAVDEAQFLRKWFLKALTKMIETSCRLDITVIISGLDMDYLCKPFGIMPDLMAVADEVLKLTAICFRCRGKNGPAIFTQRISDSKEQVLVGDKEAYEARCRVCHKKIPE